MLYRNVINTEDNDLKNYYNDKLEDITKEKLVKGYYTEDDIALVRATDFLPIDGIIYSISNIPFVCKRNDLIKRVTFNLLNTENLDENYDVTREKISKLLNRCQQLYSPYSTQYRSTVHFSLNGIVSSHIYGYFDDLKYVIIEPFKNHVNDSNLLSARGNDTYFKDYVNINEQAIILVNTVDKDNIPIDLINKYHIIFYNGQRDIALKWVLIELGYVPEIIGKDYIIPSDTAKLLEDYISKYPQEKHFFSKEYQEDDEKTLILWKKYAEDFYNYLYTNIYENIEPYRDTIEYLANIAGFDERGFQIIKQLIDEIGLERFYELVNNYNTTILKLIKNNQYPTNNEILEGHDFGYKKASNLHISKTKKST